ncbi:MAG TPA: glutamate-1-semialdehyde 2,1-aminomutase [Chitinophagaceae bacterium]|nr:glutamate-1-semialdehyde 2,1-aminomutase [Chitinophagaceae bacterium]
MFTKSQQLFDRAQQVIPGGVNSPVRAFQSVGGTPVFMESARGAYLFDADENRYIDLINSWGPMIMGHAFPPVVNAIREQALRSTSFGTPTELETRIAELMVRMVPNIDMVRMVNSGTEACMSAVRLARGYTGRNKIIMFEGCYHGHGDAFLAKAGSGMATLEIQSVPGVTAAVAADTLHAPYNDPDAVARLVSKHPNQIAAIIVEPVAGNMGCILPQPGFLEGLRVIGDREGIILILDEVMTGFRLAPGGAQELLSIRADLVTFGKIIGAGLPVGAFAGPRAIMNHIAPVGKVYQAGTLSGNPVAMAAGYALLQELYQHPQIYLDLQEKGKNLATGLKQIFREKGMPAQVNQSGSMLSVFFTEHPVTDFYSAVHSDKDRFKKFFHGMLEMGIYLPPSPFESWFISHSLNPLDMEKILKSAQEVVSQFV